MSKNTKNNPTRLDRLFERIKAHKGFMEEVQVFRDSIGLSAPEPISEEGLEDRYADVLLLFQELYGLDRDKALDPLKALAIKILNDLQPGIEEEFTKNSRQLSNYIFNLVVYGEFRPYTGGYVGINTYAVNNVNASDLEVLKKRHTGGLFIAISSEVTLVELIRYIKENFSQWANHYFGRKAHRIRELRKPENYSIVEKYTNILKNKTLRELNEIAGSTYSYPEDALAKIILKNEPELKISGDNLKWIQSELRKQGRIK